MTTVNKLIRAVAFLFVILLCGTFGYKFLNPGMDWFESFYMTMITISTVGFEEVEGITPEGRVLTVFLILAGIGLVSYVFFSISQTVVEGKLREFFGRRKLDKRISKLDGHVILCGYGRVGEIVASQLEKYKTPFLVIEKERELERRLEENSYLYIIGDATEDDTLSRAGIKSAKALIAAADSDSTNIFITLTSRELNPGVMILSRAYDEEAEKRLLRAGADKVVYPDRLGGMRIALSLLRPALISFLDVLAYSYEEGEVEVEEITVGEGCSMVGRSLIEAQIRQNYDLIVLAIRPADGVMHFNPKGDTVINTGDKLIAIGTRNDLNAFARRMDARSE